MIALKLRVFRLSEGKAMKSGKRSAGAVSKSGSREEPYFVYGNTQMTYKKSKKKKFLKGMAK